MDPCYTNVYKTGADQLTYKLPLPGDTSEANAVFYMTHRLNTDLGLKDIANPANSRDLMNNWTMVLSEATRPINYAPPSK